MPRACAQCFSPTAERVIHDNIKRRYGSLHALTNHLKVLLANRVMLAAADDETDYNYASGSAQNAVLTLHSAASRRHAQ